MTNQSTTLLLPSLATSSVSASIYQPEGGRKPYTANSRRAILLYDSHIPYHEPMATNIAFTYAKKSNVDTLIFGGDTWDCYPISDYCHDSRRMPIHEEYKQVRSILTDVRRVFPDQEIIYMEGNHENRWKRYLTTKAKELALMPCLQLPELLGFEDLSITLVDNKRRVMLGKLNVFHGHEFPNIGSGINPARTLFTKTKAHSVIGHCHRKSEHSENIIGGNSIACWSVGCLCNLSPDYMPYNNWVWGFAIVEVDNEGYYTMHNKYISKDGRVY
jgi:predicted phosphodiesterase